MIRLSDRTAERFYTHNDARDGLTANGNGVTSSPPIPVIDVAGWITGDSSDTNAPAELDAACREVGFFLIAGHGIDPQLIADLREVCHAFFALPEETKASYQPRPGSGHGGYLRQEALAYSRGDPTPPDLKETFTCHRMDIPTDDPYYRTPEAQPHFTPNIWPGEVAGFEETWRRYYHAMDALAVRLMGLFAVALGVPQDRFDLSIDRSISAIRALHYPPLDHEPLPGQLRAGAHTDFGSLTLLIADDAPGGLEVLDRNGDWIPVPQVPGAIVVNIGDLMAQWTNDRWVSTMHRVVTPPVGPGTGRLSVAFFHQPNYDAVIEPLPTCCGPDNPARYEPVRSGAHLLRKVLLQRRMAAET